MVLFTGGVPVFTGLGIPNIASGYPCSQHHVHSGAEERKPTEEAIRQLKDNAHLQANSIAQHAHSIAQLKDLITTLSLECDQVISKTAAQLQHHEHGDSSHLQKSGSVQTRYAEIDFPRFSGEDPSGWVYKCERFFEFNHIEEERRVKLAGTHLDGKAIRWYHWFEKTQKEGLNWKDFTFGLQVQFGPNAFEDATGELTKLRQVSTVRVYQERFEEFGSRTTGLPEEFFVSCFVSGLKEEIKAGVQMFQPSNISQAIGLARLQEETIEAIIRRARQPYKPTNSGWPPSTTPTMAIPKLTTTTGDEEDAEDEDDNEDMEDDTSPVLAPNQKDAPKEEPSYNSPLKRASSGSARGTPTTSKSKGKRKTNGDDVKASTNKVAPPKKAKTENEVKPSKEEIALTSKSSVRCMLTKVAAQSSSKTTSTASSSNASKTTSTASCAGPFTEHEIWAVLMRKTPVTTRDLVAKFKSRLKRKEDKDAFAAILRRISRIRKTNGPNYVVLRDK